MAPDLWVQKYAPANLKEVAGNEEAKEEIRKWALEADRGKRVQPLLISGAVGVGKTALAHALASEMGWQLLETNASDLRDAETLQKIYGMSSGASGLYGEKRMILIDEIDSVSDRQEFSALQQILRGSRQPVVLIANDAWSPKISSFRFSCKQVELRKINSGSIRKRLGEIAGKEGMEDGELAESIAKSASGDIRGAINDLQASQGMSAFNAEISGRDREENIFESVRTVFKTMHYDHALEAARNFDTREFDTFSKWLEENVPLEYENAEELAAAMHWLSRADVFRGRILRRQNWGYFRYVTALATAGVALAKHDTYRKFSKYQFPSIIRQLGQTKKNRELLKGILRKISRKMHTSFEDAAYAKASLQQEGGFAEYFGLNEEEGSFASELEQHEKEKKGKRKKKD